MRRKCLVLSSRSLLAQGVASLLTLNPALEVALADLEQEDLVKVFQAVKPEVVMIDLSEMDVVGKPFKAFLQGKPAMMLVCLDSRSSTILIIQTESRVLENAQQLFFALEGKEIVTKGGKT